jgi:hypothetical protein
MKRLAPARRAARAKPTVHALERRRHVSRPGEVADYGACSRDRNRCRPAQQHPQAVTAFGQFPQQVLTDETGSAGEGKQHAGAILWSAALLPRRSRPNPASFAVSDANCTPLFGPDGAAARRVNRRDLGQSPIAPNVANVTGQPKGTRHAAAIALLGSHMAGSFVAAADGHGGTLVTEAQIQPPPSHAHT